MIGPPKPYPCASCPYRRDVPSGVWDESEYRKLPEYDNETAMQPPGLFLCHQDDERVCSGWAGCHDGNHLLALRFAASGEHITMETFDAIIDYVSPVPLFGSGTQAAAHGMADVPKPSPAASAVVAKVQNRRARRG